MNRQIKLIIAVAVVVGLAALMYFNLKDWHDSRVEQAVDAERQIWERKTTHLEKEVNALSEELTNSEKTAVSEEKVAEALGPVTTAESSAAKQLTLQDLEGKILNFFKYLDRQPYVASRNLEGGTYGVYRKAIDLLTQHKPVLTGETEDLYRLTKNMAYFYRILGKDTVHLAVDVLANEVEILEPVMNTFYTWYTFEPSAASTLSGRPSQPVQYRYAAYFLNTLAGRSYLLRRDSRIRILSTYYCILVLDRSNDGQINYLGIDIRPHIRSAYRDIQDHRRLADRRAYLKALDQLAIKYGMADGS